MLDPHRRSLPGPLVAIAAWRFACVYLVVYCIPIFLYALPRGRWLWDQHCRVIDAVAPGIARVVGVRYALTPTLMNGSGDTTANFLWVLATAALSALIATLWTLRSGRRHSPLHADLLRIYVRHALGLCLVSYGLIKVLTTQFVPPSEIDLAATLGDLSPMGLLWTFMGYSTAYCVLTGIAEVLAGALLIWRRTATLGALIAIVVLVNVVALNLSYDVPVKVLSFHLLLMAGFVAAPDVRRLVDVLVLQRPTAPRPDRPAVPSRRIERLRPWSKAVFLIICVGSLFHRQYSSWTWEMPTSDLDGVYAIERFERDGSGALTSDPTAWRLVGIGAWGIKIWRMDGSYSYVDIERDQARHTLTLTASGPDARPPDAKPLVLAYTRPDSARLVLEGQDDGRHLSIVLRRRDMSRSLLVSRGFHWINEVPLNH